MAFPGIEFYPDGMVPKDTRMVLVCPGDKFPAAGIPSGDFVHWIRSMAEKESPVSLGERELQLLPVSLWKSGGYSLPDPMPADFSLRLIDPTLDLRQVESRIIALQVKWLNIRNVRVEDPLHFFMEGLQDVGAGSTLCSGVVIRGKSRIGEGTHIMPYCYIEDSEIGDNCTLLPGCVIRDSRVGAGAQLGPYTHLRQQADAGADTRVGNFVEMKKSHLGDGSKASHLSYLGDAEIGKNVNVGAGTITCNYDGENKHQTTIEDGVFIGSGTELVAPVRLHKNSFVGAGSTVTEDVPEGALALSRMRQRNLLGWRKRRKKKTAAGKKE